MPDLDFTAATEAARAAYRASAAEMFGCAPEELSMSVADHNLDAALRAAAPLIERAALEQAAARLHAWADEVSDDAITGPRASLRRHIHACARKIFPPPTPEEIAELIRKGLVIACKRSDIEGSDR